MTLPCLILLAAVGAAANEKVLDAFDYPGPEAAQRAWVASGSTPRPVSVTHSGRKMVEFEVPFAKNPDLLRTILDRDVSLDLSVPGEFTLDLAAENTEAVGSVNLYFRSGGGWFSASAGVQKAGWQTLRFSKAAFRIEDKPAGWNKIDGVRIITMGVVPEFQKRGIDTVFYVQTFDVGVKRGYRWAEMSWVLEDNTLMNRVMQLLGAKLYKKHRICETRI